MNGNISSSPAPGAELRRCIDCGRGFLYRESEQAEFSRRGWAAPPRCPLCRRAAGQRQDRKRARQEATAARQARAEKQREFEARLKAFNVVDLDAVSLDSARSLVILGNGFDLMHGVASSYMSFRDSMGRGNDLREALETYLRADDLWWNFEEALATLNTDLLAAGVVTFLQAFDAFDEDAQAADYYMAIDAGMSPADTIANRLQGYFRRWVDSLRVPGGERPLIKLLRPGARCLSFNYTEFAETLYGLREVCYIHGDRRNKRERLILGHAVNGGTDFGVPKYLDKDEQTLLKIAGDDAATHLGWYDKETSKNSAELIKRHTAFFEALSGIDAVAVIGHSMSAVDRVYYQELASRLGDLNRVRWYFGCYGLSDLEQMERLCAALGIGQNAVSVIRTDVIPAPAPSQEPHKSPTARSPAEKLRLRSSDGRWTVKTAGQSLRIVAAGSGEVGLELIFPAFINEVFFSPSEDLLFAVLRGVEPGIFVFRRGDERWRFAAELEYRANQSIVNRRLRRVYLYDETLTFVYNNRVRRYSLADGRLIQNTAVQHAWERSYDGQDISGLFVRARQV